MTSTEEKVDSGSSGQAGVSWLELASQRVVFGQPMNVEQKV